MSHFLVYVVGEEPELQMALYDYRLQVDRCVATMTDDDIRRMSIHFDTEDLEELAEDLREWNGHDGFVQDGKVCYMTSSNPNYKWDWWIMGGRWSGHLMLHPGRLGMMGRATSWTNDPPYGVRSADQARFGDIDWEGMHEQRRHVAASTWPGHNPTDPLNWGGSHSWKNFVEEQSHIVPFALLVEGDWYQRTEVGWWGVMLDAPPIEEWEEFVWDLLSCASDDTLITVADCHLSSDCEEQ